MRPVRRGARPRATFADYNDARVPLVERLGNYCSYCEMPYPTDVEHKLPKHVHPRRERSWTNFLLSCRHCNSIKHAQQRPGDPRRPGAALAHYLWPDMDNTARAFAYDRHRNDVTVAPGLAPVQASAAQRTIEMTGIDRRPGAPGWSAKDKRWRQRAEAWGLAEEALQRLASQELPELRATIADLAGKTGFWSVWRAVFAHDQEMLQRIDRAFQGTAPECFDPVTRQLVARPRGQL
jgi:HNH endonuclease